MPLQSQSKPESVLTNPALDNTIISTPEETTLKEALSQSNIEFKDVVPKVLGWSSQYNIVTEWHINSIIISLMASIHYLKNVELDIDVNNRFIECKVFLGLWSLLSKSRIKKLNKRVQEVMNIYVPGYTTEISYRYGKVDNRSR